MESTEMTRTSPPATPAALDADTREPNPWLESAGRYKDDPSWDAVMESIRSHRAEMDAEWDESE